MIDRIIIELDGIGSITLERSLRARRVVISIRPFKGVRVAVPRRVSFREAEKFVISKIRWIKQHLDKIREYEKRRAFIRDFEDIDMDAAKRTLSDRLEQLAEKHGFKYGKLTVRRQKTRWGSCSHKNNISLNARLVRIPDALRDYVILHELMHTRIPNHSREFWTELDKHVGNAKALAKRLRTSGLELD